jgi:mannose-6-phosphate isomerase-like protein (cupin superfamily)
MGATKLPGAARSQEEAVGTFEAEGCSSPRFWGNGPHDTYDWHTHTYHKILFCLEGSITFHTNDGDVLLETGDRLDIEPGTDHAATVGGRGCSCVEAKRG